MIYVVAEADPQRAIDILKAALARPADEYEDLGRVRDILLKALSLSPGQVARTRCLATRNSAQCSSSSPR
jgi:hypothetical protein